MLESGNILEQDVVQPIPYAICHDSVDYYVNKEGFWDIYKCDDFVNQQRMSKIMNTGPPFNRFVDDVPTWSLTPNGSFTTKSTSSLVSHGNLYEWFLDNLKQNPLGRFMIFDWHLVFGVTIWLLWRCRNSKVF